MIWVACIGAVYVFGLSRSRKLRRRSFDLVRVMGDVIAFRKGKFVKRLVKKQVLKRGGRAVNKLKLWR
jgi:hypothetical protein